MHRALAETIESLQRALSTSDDAHASRVGLQALSSLGVLLAGAVLGRQLVQNLAATEQVLRDSGFDEMQLFHGSFRQWQAFRSEYEKWVAGPMSVNERLSEFGLLKSFDDACGAADLDAVASLLKRVHVDEVTVARIVSEVKTRAI